MRVKPAIGILGGMGPRATHYFVGELLNAVERSARPSRDQDYPDLHVHYACSNPDRTHAVLEDDPARLRQILLGQLRSLVDNGCETIVVPCVSAHVVLDPIPDDLPVLDLRRAIFEHLAGTAPSGSVGLLGTRATNMSFRRGASAVAPGMTVRLLQDDDEDVLMSVIYGELKGGAITQSTVDRLVSLCEVLRDAGATHVIAGCTEIEMCLAASRRCPRYVVFPLRVAAQRVIAQHALVSGCVPADVSLGALASPAGSGMELSEEIAAWDF